jgi:hypothetical protein
MPSSDAFAVQPYRQGCRLTRPGLSRRPRTESTEALTRQGVKADASRQKELTRQDGTSMRDALIGLVLTC